MRTRIRLDVVNGQFFNQAPKPMHLACDQRHLFLMHLIEHPKNLPELLLGFQVLSTEFSQQVYNERFLPGDWLQCCIGEVLGITRGLLKLILGAG